MLDIKFVRMNPDKVKENIKKKFQDEKLPLVDEVLELDQENRDIKQEVEALRADRNKISKQIGACMAQGKKEEAEELKKKVQENADRVESLSAKEKDVEAKIRKIMMVIPNIIDPSVPILNSRYHITRILWRVFMELTLRAQEKSREMDSII